MIKKILFYFTFISIAIFAQAVGPKVTIPQINYNFDYVPIDSSLGHTYMIYNGGGGVLKLWGVKTTCKCISASLDKSTLTPTDSARLDVSYTNIKSSQGLDKYISIKTNDPNNPDVRIFITRTIPTNSPTLSSMPKDTTGGAASVAPVIYFPVSDHDFGKLKQGTIVSYTFKFMNKGNSTLKIKDITTSCGCTAALVKDKEIAPGKKGELAVQFDSSGKIGKLSRKITILSNDPKQSYKVLTIYADVETK
ncbi:MAG: DUF1573 domain-containing protein [Bacteroidetes bacterium]|nr:DUF1573 domain-containing protein [Bacteroidota bacterium]